MAKTKMGKSNPAHRFALESGFRLAGFNAQNHRVYDWTDPNGRKHMIVTSNGMHGGSDHIFDLKHVRSRIRRCKAGACRCLAHVHTATSA